MSLSRELSAIRNRMFLHVLTTTLPGCLVGCYIMALVVGVSGDRLVKALVVLLSPIIVFGALAQYLNCTRILGNAMRDRPDDGPGSKLARILTIPRKVELYSNFPIWLIGGLFFGFCSATFFTGEPTAERIIATSLAGMVAGLFVSLFPGMIFTMALEGDVFPLAYEEMRRAPGLLLHGEGFLWPRQRWYLPYAFAVALLSLLAFSSFIVVTRWREASATLGVSMAQSFGPGAGTMVVSELDNLFISTAIPVALVALVLLGAFLVTGNMLARRQARAAGAVEASLRSIARGAPEIPHWVATDETGDLASAAAAVTGEMTHVFSQLRAMAAGDLGQELRGESGLMSAFRDSQTAMLELARRMVALSNGDVSGEARIPGDLGVHFGHLQTSFQAIVDQAQTIAGGDLRRDVDVPGALGQAIQRMTANLRSMVGQTQGVSGNIEDLVVNLQSAAAQLSSATTEQVAAVTETANTMTEMSQTSAVSADRASELINQGEAAAQVVEAGVEAAESAVNAMHAISESLGRVSGASKALAERALRIESIVETVGFLADQSSTLAINAAIEASRAGVAGQGFAVVAREMRTLASDSRQGASQIREVLAEIKERTQQVDGSVAAGTQTVTEGSKAVERLGEVVNQLGITVGDSVGLMRQVEGSARQHQAGVAQVSQALTNLQKASESIRDGARLLGELSGKARQLSTRLQKSSGAYSLPAASA
jgi:methyl-accepting chemotaxis protein